MVKTCHIPIILLCILIVSCGSPQNQATTDVAAPVSVQEVTLKPIEETLTATGTVSAFQSVDIKSEAEGLYRPANNPKTGRPFSIGDEVKKGQVLVTLESIELENTIKIDSQKMNLDLCKSEFEKQQSLYDKGGVTLRDLKNSEKSYMDAKYAYENALISLSKLKIPATLDGIITDWTVYPAGVKISSNSPIARIMNYRRLTMDASLPEKQLGRIKENMAARITNVNLPGKTLNAKITQVSPALDATTRTFKATLDIDNPSGDLKPGMFVKAEIVVERHDNVVVIPKEIILSRRQSRSVFVVERGLAAERVITTGLESPDSLEVVSGLNAQDRLVIKGYETLRARARVKVEE
jgi:membrane fusion protein, multidrug efflux system